MGERECVCVCWERVYYYLHSSAHLTDAPVSPFFHGPCKGRERADCVHEPRHVVHVSDEGDAFCEGGEEAGGDVAVVAVDEAHGLAECQGRHDIVAVVRCVFDERDELTFFAAEPLKQLVGKVLDLWRKGRQCRLECRIPSSAPLTVKRLVAVEMQRSLHDIEEGALCGFGLSPEDGLDGFGIEDGEFTRSWPD